MTVAFVFSGQGAQYEGMCEDLYDAYPCVKQVYQQAETLLGYDVLTLSQEKLDRTYYTQVAILTMSTAIARVLDEQGIRPEVVAGLSLGEYSALVCAQSLSFETALLLLQKRGQFMEEASQSVSSKMLAVLTEDRELVETVCQLVQEQGHYVAPANYNTTGQIVIAGVVEAIDIAHQLLTEKGVKRCIPLVVSGAFHTKLMHDAAEKLVPFIKTVDFERPQFPVISNTYARDMRDMDISQVLIEQIENPVLFEDSIKEMIRLGVDTFVEIGPKKVLSAFIKKVDKSVTTYHVENKETLVEVLKVFGK